MKFTTVALFLLLSACTKQQVQATKDVSKTVNDVARTACEVMFGEEELPQGITLEDICGYHEDLQPIIRNLLAAKRIMAQANGFSLPEDDASE